ncbi:MAG: hypothetical protein ACT4RN_22295 [Pseudonocardia sp.]
MTASLIVDPADEDAEPFGSVEGAGVVSSAADLADALAAQRPDVDRIAFTAAAYGLDQLGTAMDPLGGLARAGVGWLIEHVWFLHEPLDWLAGDPSQITAQAQTWFNAAAALAEVDGSYGRELAAVAGWAGAAGDEYRAAVADYRHHLGRAAQAAEIVSVEILDSGAAVGTLRAVIRDLIAEFVVLAIEKVALGLLLAPVSAGTSAAVGLTSAVADAVGTASRIARELDMLLDVLRASERALGVATDLAQRVLAGAVEAGKQVTGAEQERGDWSAEYTRLRAGQAPPPS